MEEKILVGLDGSKGGWNAFDYAISDAQKKNIDKITAIHFTPDRANEGKNKKSEVLREAEYRAKNQEIEIETVNPAAWKEITPMESKWEPSTAIVKYAEENNFNHIIVGSKGRSGISRILLGSVAEGIVRKAHCIVTVVRNQEE